MGRKAVNAAAHKEYEAERSKARALLRLCPLHPTPATPRNEWFGRR